MILKTISNGALFLAAALYAIAMPVQALQIQTTVVNQGGGIFHYEFSVVNDDPLADLFAVTITDAPLGDGLIGGSLTAPTGFLASYDPGLGLLDFLADTTPVFPEGISGVFAFDSGFNPNANFNSFEALTLTDFPVPTVAGQVTIVPVPGVLAMLGLGLGLLLSGRKLTSGRKPGLK